MTNREFFIRCWEQEHPAFVRVLEALPPGRLDYRPDPRSRSAGELAWLQVQEKRCWFELLDTGRIDWTDTPLTMTIAEMVAAYERAHLELAPRLKSLDDRTWEEHTTQFVMDGRVHFELSMGRMFWLGLFDAIHHRGQLSVYIRPMGGRVPSIYGPSADNPLV